MFFALQPFDDSDLAFFGSHTVKLRIRITYYAVIAERQIVVLTVFGFDYAFDLQIEFFSEVVVSFVVSGYAHYRARAVRVEYVVAYPYGDFIAVYGVDAVRTGEYARLFSRGGKSFDFACLSALEFISFYGFFLFGGGNFVYERMLGSKYYVGYAEYRIGTRSEYSESISAFALEFYFTARGFANPVTLHSFCFFGPVESIETLQKLLGVLCNSEKPLSKVFSEYCSSASFARTVHNLFVSEYGIARGAPVDGSFFSVSQPVVIKLKENPLRPLVIVGHTGFYLVIPVEGRAHSLELFFHSIYIFERAVLRVDTRFYSIVFSGQTESVEAHRLKDFLTLHTHKASVAVGRSVVVPMSCVQLCTRGVGEHFEHVIFVFDSRFVKGVELCVVPLFLPLFFDFDKIHNYSG